MDGASQPPPWVNGGMDAPPAGARGGIGSLDRAGPAERMMPMMSTRVPLGGRGVADLGGRGGRGRGGPERAYGPEGVYGPPEAVYGMGGRGGGGEFGDDGGRGRGGWGRGRGGSRGQAPYLPGAAEGMSEGKFGPAGTLFVRVQSPLLWARWKQQECTPRAPVYFCGLKVLTWFRFQWTRAGICLY